MVGYSATKGAGRAGQAQPECSRQTLRTAHEASSRRSEAIVGAPLVAAPSPRIGFGLG